MWSLDCAIKMLQASRRAEEKTRLYLTAWFVTAREAYDKHRRRGSRKWKKRKWKKKNRQKVPRAFHPSNRVPPVACVLLHLDHNNHRLQYDELIIYSQSFSSTRLNPQGWMNTLRGTLTLNWYTHQIAFQFYDSKLSLVAFTLHQFSANRQHSELLHSSTLSGAESWSCKSIWHDFQMLHIKPCKTFFDHGSILFVVFF